MSLPHTASGPAVSLRPVDSGDDRTFLEELYGTTRADELRLLDWSEDQQRDFVRMQFEAQDHHYRSHFAEASFEVVECAGERIGRLYVFEGARETRLMEITLLPEWRGRGIGSRLVRGVLARAAEHGRYVILHVEPHNPARRLYERLGFVAQGVEHHQIKMRWEAASAARQAKTAS